MNCKNCNAQLHPNSDYCHVCGAKVIRNRLTLKNLFEHLSETFFNYDNKLLRTIIDLFRKPEEVIGGYISGVRKRYVNPVSLFGLALTLTGIYFIIVNKFFPEMLDFSALTVKGQEEFQQKNMQFVKEYQSIIMMMYVPIYALMARVVFFDKKNFNYTELLVVFLYIQSQISIVSAFIVIILGVVGISNGFVGIMTIPLMILYSGFCLKRLYSLSFSEIIIRTVLFGVVLAVVFVIMTLAMFVNMYFNGDLERMIEAQRATIETSNGTN